jgi:hypothetical protein
MIKKKLVENYQVMNKETIEKAVEEQIKWLESNPAAESG